MVLRSCFGGCGCAGWLDAAADWGLDSDTPTVADYLKELDYSTHLIGKWHL